MALAIQMFMADQPREQWVANCDVPGCGGTEPLLRCDDVFAIIDDGLIPEFRDGAEERRRRALEIIRTVACGRGWSFGSHVGEPDHLSCPAH